jgi:hypothetical protein
MRRLLKSFRVEGDEGRGRSPPIPTRPRATGLTRKKSMFRAALALLVLATAGQVPAQTESSPLSREESSAVVVRLTQSRFQAVNATQRPHVLVFQHDDGRVLATNLLPAGQRVDHFVPPGATRGIHLRVVDVTPQAPLPSPLVALRLPANAPGATLWVRSTRGALLSAFEIDGALVETDLLRSSLETTSLETTEEPYQTHSTDRYDPDDPRHVPVPETELPPRPLPPPDDPLPPV